MRRLSFLLACLPLAAAARGVGPRPVAAPTQQSAAVPLGRSLYGVVLDAANRPLATAIVYLKNDQTKEVRTVFTGPDGAYSFHNLAPNTGYHVYAVWKNQRSPVRVDSQYETAPEVRLDLQIPVQ